MHRLVNEVQVDSIVHGDGGIFAIARPGTVILGHSTMPPESAERFARLAGERGLHWLDAPVSGARLGAEAATLTFPVGGDADILDRCRPFLKFMGSNVFHLGSAGRGQVAKLVNGLMLHVCYAATLEAMTLSNDNGIDEATMVAIARVGTGINWSIINRGHMDDLVEHHSQGTEEVINTHMRKDMVDALIAARVSRTPMPLAGPRHAAVSGIPAGSHGAAQERRCPGWRWHGRTPVAAAGPRTTAAGCGARPAASCGGLFLKAPCSPSLPAYRRY